MQVICRKREGDIISWGELERASKLLQDWTRILLGPLAPLPPCYNLTRAFGYRRYWWFSNNVAW